MRELNWKSIAIQVRRYALLTIALVPVVFAVLYCRSLAVGEFPRVDLPEGGARPLDRR